jgi:ATP-dependent Clp protease adaptor protein ClpS
MAGIGYEFESDVITEDDIDVKEPKSYHVVLYNDNYTTMDFVVHVLETIFHHPPRVAEKIMLDVHEKGKGIAGTYTRDIAETRALQTRTLAKEHSFPLKCVAEPA